MEAELKLDIHNETVRNSSARRRLDASNIPKQDKKAILDFINSISASEDLSLGREAKLIDELRKIRANLKKNFSKLRKNDVEKYILWLNRSSLSPDTKKDYRQILKRFMKWYWIKLGKHKKNDSYPDIVSWIKNPRKETNRNGVVREVLLEEQDVLKIINSCKQPMWRALLWILWEAGLRPGELLNLRVRDIEQTDSGIRLNIRFGKTGARKLPMVQARQSVLIWLDTYPNKKPESLLFPISYTRTLIKVKEIAYNIGINDKKVGLKYWRKARATYLSRFFSSSQLQYWFGWSNIKTSEAYIFASEKDVIGAVMQLNNISEMKPNGTIVKFRTCIKCEERNDYDKDYCMKCTHPLTPKALKKSETKQRTIVRDEFVKMFMKLKSMNNEDGKEIISILDNPKKENIKEFERIFLQPNRGII